MTMQRRIASRDACRFHMRAFNHVTFQVDNKIVLLKVLKHIYKYTKIYYNSENIKVCEMISKM